MLDVFVFDCFPPRDEYGVGVIVRAYLQVIEVALGDERTGDGRAAPVDLLGTVIAEIALRHVDVYAVGTQGQYGTGGQDGVEKPLFLEVVVLECPALVDEVHGLLHLVLHEPVVRGEREKEAVEPPHVGAVFGLTVHLHVGLPCGHGHVRGIHDVNAFSCIGDLPVGKEGYADDHEDGSDQASRREKSGEPHLGFYVLDDHCCFVLLHSLG